MDLFVIRYSSCIISCDLWKTECCFIILGWEIIIYYKVENEKHSNVIRMNTKWDGEESEKVQAKLFTQLNKQKVVGGGEWALHLKGIESVMI